MIENVDFFIHFVKFPTNEQAACVTVNRDGTYTILVNQEVSESRQRKAIQHELKHIEDGHLYLNDIEVDRIELMTHEHKRRNV